MCCMQPGYSLSLSIPEDDRWYDDKVDVLERNGLAASSAFNLLPGQPPSEEMMGFMRLMQLSGEQLGFGVQVRHPDHLMCLGKFAF